MRSEGVGRMLLYTPNGSLMPGFDRVVFSKQVSTRLASVGDICDADIVCVFDKAGLKTFKANDVEKCLQDERDPNSRLYPLTLFRKNGEREKHGNTIAALHVTDPGGADTTVS